MTHDLTLNGASQVWSTLTGLVEALIEQWEFGDDVPSLAALIPDEPQTLRRLALVELVKVDLEYRWSRRRSPRLLEDYAREFPDLAEDGVFPADLIYEEFHVRRQSGDECAATEYFDRFDAQRDELEQLLGADHRYRTTMLAGQAGPEAIEIGDQFDDFDIITQLGQGAFARVYLARQRSMQRLVALKVSADRGDEPRNMAQMDHPHIVRVYDQRIVPDQGLRLLYMPHIAGGTLQNVIVGVRSIAVEQRNGSSLLAVIDAQLDRHGQPEPVDSLFRRSLQTADWPQVVCLIGSRLASALEHAHARGVLHRDIKPANVLMAADGNPLLADFNISFGTGVEGATAEAFFGGSLPYMSPEQLEACHPGRALQADKLDARSDIYSLGVVLWELLTDHRPFGDEPVASGWPATLDAMIERRSNSVPEQESKLQSPLRNILRRCLDFDPDRRLSSGTALARELELCRQPPILALLDGPQRGIKRLLRQWPITVLLVAAVLPNALAAVFNLIYNHSAIVASLSPAFEDKFWSVQAAINTIAFPLGLGLLAWLARSVARQLGTLSAANSRSRLSMEDARHQSLKLGHFASGVSIALWVVAGFAYPVSIHLLAGSLPASAWIHFLASLVICGLIAAAYPFLTVTMLTVGVFYPALFRASAESSADRRILSHVSRAGTVYLALAAAVPMFGVALLVLIESTNRPALLTLSAGGVTAFVTAFFMHRMIQRNITLLLSAVRRTSASGDGANTAIESLDFVA